MTSCRGKGDGRERDGRGKGCAFVAEQHPEDVDPENKSTVLIFHHGKKRSKTHPFALAVIKTGRKKKKKKKKMGI